MVAEVVEVTLVVVVMTVAGEVWGNGDAWEHNNQSNDSSDRSGGDGWVGGGGVFTTIVEVVVFEVLGGSGEKAVL